VVAGAVDAAIRGHELRAPQRLAGWAIAGLAVAAAGVLGWALNGAAPSAPIVAEAAQVDVQTSTQRSVIDIGDARIESGPDTAFAVTARRRRGDRRAAGSSSWSVSAASGRRGSFAPRHRGRRRRHAVLGRLGRPPRRGRRGVARAVRAVRHDQETRPRPAGRGDRTPGWSPTLMARPDRRRRRRARRPRWLRSRRRPMRRGRRSGPGATTAAAMGSSNALAAAPDVLAATRRCPGIAAGRRSVGGPAAASRSVAGSPATAPRPPPPPRASPRDDPRVDQRAAIRAQRVEPALDPRA
jgi:hypothetical protein